MKDKKEAPVDNEEFTIAAEDVAGIRTSLWVYRILAWVVGLLLVVLVVIGMPMKYLWYDGSVVVATGMPHGWLYMALLIAAYNLGRRVGWSIKWFIMIMAAGTIPFLSFVAEHYATKNVKKALAKLELEHVSEESTDDS